MTDLDHTFSTVAEAKAVIDAINKQTADAVATMEAANRLARTNYAEAIRDIILLVDVGERDTVAGYAKRRMVAI